MSNILEFTGLTKNDISPEKVVNALLDAKLEKILVIGIDESGELYVASHTGDIGAALFLMERAKYHLCFEVKT